MPPPEKGKYGKDHDLKIHEQGHVFYIEEVIFKTLDHFINIHSIAIFYLSPGSDPRFHFMQVNVVGGSLYDLVNKILSFGPWSDKRHLTFQYIPEIGYFIQFPLSHEFTEICEPSVI